MVDGEDDTGGVDVVLEPPAGGTVATVDETTVVVTGADVVVVEDSTVVVVVGSGSVVVVGATVVVVVGVGMHFQPRFVCRSSNPTSHDVA